jgi:hypothetical protein
MEPSGYGCSTSPNVALASSWNRSSQRLLDHPGIEPPTTVWDAWRHMLISPDRFAFLDSGTLLEAASPVSAEWRDRYDHLAMPVVTTADQQRLTG